MLKQIKEFMLDESGLETVEWAIVGGLVVALVAFLPRAVRAVPRSALKPRVVHPQSIQRRLA